MLYFIYMQDIEDNTEIRGRLLNDHMQHIGNYVDRIKLGGPLMRTDGESQAGGILFLEADSEAEVREIVNADPYFQAGLWDDVKILPFKEILNGWR